MIPARFLTLCIDASPVLCAIESTDLCFEADSWWRMRIDAPRLDKRFFIDIFPPAQMRLRSMWTNAHHSKAPSPYGRCSLTAIVELICVQNPVNCWLDFNEDGYFALVPKPFRTEREIQTPSK